MTPFLFFPFLFERPRGKVADGEIKNSPARPNWIGDQHRAKIVKIIADQAVHFRRLDDSVSIQIADNSNKTSKNYCM
jgi:hypothetical protein